MPSEPSDSTPVGQVKSVVPHDAEDGSKSGAVPPADAMPPAAHVSLILYAAICDMVAAGQPISDQMRPAFSGMAELFRVLIDCGKEGGKPPRSDSVGTTQHVGTMPEFDPPAERRR